jgi:hypothetical protein
MSCGGVLSKTAAKTKAVRLVVTPLALTTVVRLGFSDRLRLSLVVLLSLPTMMRLGFSDRLSLSLVVLLSLATVVRLGFSDRLSLSLVVLLSLSTMVGFWLGDGLCDGRGDGLGLSLVVLLPLSAVVRRRCALVVLLPFSTVVRLRISLTSRKRAQYMCSSDRTTPLKIVITAHSERPAYRLLTGWRASMASIGLSVTTYATAEVPKARRGRKVVNLILDNEE